MNYVKVMKTLDSIEEFTEMVYLEATDVKAMITSARKKGIDVDLDNCLEELRNFEECYKASMSLYTCLLKMKVALLENGVIMTREDFLKFLIEIDVAEI